jgi:predicted RNase H-like HicB family nuclease
LGKIKTITADLIRDDDGGYSVFCPELDISARGRSMEDAFDKFEVVRGLNKKRKKGKKGKRWNRL